MKDSLVGNFKAPTKKEREQSELVEMRKSAYHMAQSTIGRIDDVPKTKTIEAHILGARKILKFLKKG